MKKQIKKKRFTTPSTLDENKSKLHIMHNVNWIEKKNKKKDNVF
jgi:hypothetical protein